MYAYMYACVLYLLYCIYMRVYVQKEAPEYGIQTNGTHLKTTYFIDLGSSEKRRESFYFNHSLQTLWKNLGKIIMLVNSFANTMMKCTYFVLMAVKILLRVESMTDLKTFATKISSNFTLKVAI